MRDKLNCPNCGAPITGIKCEYCGTMFFDMADLKIGEASYLRMRMGDSVNTFMAYPVRFDITFEPVQTTTLWADTSPIAVIQPRSQDITINIEFKAVVDSDEVLMRKVIKGR